MASLDLLVALRAKAGRARAGGRQRAGSCGAVRPGLRLPRASARHAPGDADRGRPRRRSRPPSGAPPTREPARSRAMPSSPGAWPTTGSASRPAAKPSPRRGWLGGPGQGLAQPDLRVRAPIRRARAPARRRGPQRRRRRPRPLAGGAPLTLPPDARGPAAEPLSAPARRRGGRARSRPWRPEGGKGPEVAAVLQRAAPLLVARQETQAHRGQARLGFLHARPSLGIQRADGCADPRVRRRCDPASRSRSERSRRSGRMPVSGLV